MLFRFQCQTDRLFRSRLNSISHNNGYVISPALSGWHPHNYLFTRIEILSYNHPHNCNPHFLFFLSFFFLFFVRRLKLFSRKVSREASIFTIQTHLSFSIASGLEIGKKILLHNDHLFWPLGTHHGGREAGGGLRLILK